MSAGSAGYSGTPLANKLGLKDGQAVLFVNLPDGVADLAGAAGFARLERCEWPGLIAAGGGFDMVHAFTKSRAELETHAAALDVAIVPDGTIWISWPKKAAKVPTDMSEDVVREVLLPFGLVDVKVCAVDEVWSGLKLVVRRELRSARDE